MSTTPTEFLVRNARAHADCIGTQRHGRSIMISFLPENGGPVIDWFLRQEDAEFLHKELGEKLELNRKKSS